MPLGVWVLMDDYMQNPNTDLATQKILEAGGGYVDRETGKRILSDEEKDLAQRLLFVERHTSFPFKVEHKKVTCHVQAYSHAVAFDSWSSSNLPSLSGSHLQDWRDH